MLVGALLAGSAVLSACAAGGTAGGGDDPAGGGGLASGTVTVFAASSLAEVVGALADVFEADHEGVRVVVSVAGSSTLREQLLAGAPADVFVPADPAHLDAVGAERPFDSPPVPVALNRLTLAVPAGNPAAVAGLADLGRPELLVGLCAAPVPCGALARAALAAAGISPAPDTETPSVRALATLLAAGELDVGVVYATDARDARIDDLGWPVSGSAAAPAASYSAAVPADAANPAGGRAFVSFLASPQAQAVFAEHGFGTGREHR